MKRAAQLLLLLLASWLLSAAPGSRFTRGMPMAPLTVSSEERAGASVEHAVLDVAVVQVARAPLLARVPAPLPELARSPSWREARVVALPDLREAVRRAQTRRRVPRLTPEEPPWC